MDPLGAPLPPPAPTPLPVEALPKPPAPRPANLSPGWRWTLGCGWATVMAGIGVIANGGFLIGNSPFWIDWILIPFALPVLTLIAIAVDWRYELALSFVAVAATAVIGVIDLFHARAVGVGELAFAFVALLITISALAGRNPQRT